MVRYPHTAIVTASVETIVSGAFSSVSSTTTTIAGRLELPQPNSPPRRIKSESGDWIDAKGRFFTRATKVANADTLTINGTVYKIVTWVEYQTSSEIWLD